MWIFELIAYVLVQAILWVCCGYVVDKLIDRFTLKYNKKDKISITTI